MSTLIQHGDSLDLREILKNYDIEERCAETEEEFEYVRDLRAILDDLATQLGYPFDGLQEYASNEPQLIAASKFTEYVKELEMETNPSLSEIGIVADYIDWQRYGDDNIRPGFNEVTIEGFDYLIRGY